MASVLVPPSCLVEEQPTECCLQQRGGMTITPFIGVQPVAGVKVTPPKVAGMSTSPTRFDGF